MLETLLRVLELAMPVAADGMHSLEAFRGMSDIAVRSVMEPLPGIGESSSVRQYVVTMKRGAPRCCRE
jgi:hypothetical protein